MLLALVDTDMAKGEMSDEELIKILARNQKLNFVSRALNPHIFPVLDNKDGTVSTHSMAWGEGEEPDQNYVYPTVVQKGDKLVRLKDKQAFQHAMDTGEYLQFKTPEQADWFSRNYKNIWKPKI